MAESFLIEVACPNCRNPIDVREHGSHIKCDACSSQFVLTGRLCPKCGSYHQKNASICGQCGNALNRVCRKCNTTNWSGDEYCAHCGTPMDILDIIAHSHQDATTQRLQDQMELARRLKQESEESSQRRMAEMMEREEARLAEVKRRQEIRRKHDMKMFVGLGVFVAIVMVFVLMYLLAGG